MTTRENLHDFLDRAEKSFSGEETIFMLNLLQYRDRALYNGNQSHEPCSGRDAYFTRYIPVFGRLTEGLNIKPLWVGKVGAQLIAPVDEPWDDIALIRYPDFATFKRVAESADYEREAEPHRLAALAGWKLIAATELTIAR